MIVRFTGIGLFLYYVAIFTCNAQTSPFKLDSLLRLANTPDSHAVNALEHVQRYYFNRGLYDSTLKYARRALSLAKKLDLKKKVAKVNFTIGLSYTNKTRYDSAELYLQEAIKFVPLVRDTILEVNTLNALAKLNSFRTDYTTAMEYLMEAVRRIDQATLLKVKEFLPMTYGNIGNTLIAEGQLQKGNEYLQKALVLRNYPDEHRFRLFINLDVFDVYMRQNNAEAAKVYLDSAIALSHVINNIVATSIVANNEGVYYQTIKDFPRALDAYMKSYQLSERSGNDYQKAEVCANIASMHQHLKNYKEAERFAREAEKLGLAVNHFTVVAGAYQVLQDIAVAREDYKSALQYAGLHKAYTDSSTNAETKRQILSLESKYQHAKKEREIANLTSLAAQRELEVLKRNRWLIGGGIISGAAVLILGLLFKYSRQRQVLAEREQALQAERIKYLEGQQQMASLQGILKGQNEERGRLAKDLHDGLGGLLSGVKFSLTNMKSNLVLDAENTHAFERSLDMLDSAIAELRRVAHNMMPEVLIKFGLHEALKSYCDAVQQSGIFNLEFQCVGKPVRLNSDTEIIAYRIVQELLNNAAKHAKASTVLVQLVFDESEISITVEDNGTGLDVLKIQQSTGSGWANIRSRVQYLKGQVDVTSDTSGTSVHVQIPIEK